MIEAVRLAVHRHPSILAARESVQSARVSTDIARSAYYPRLNAGVGHGADSGRRSGETGTLGVSQVLYDFGKTSTTAEVADAEVQLQEAELQRITDEIALQAAEAVVRTHQYQELERLSAEQVDAVEQVLDLADKRAQAGLSREVDAMQARSRVDAARANRWQIKAQLNEARLTLQSLLGDASPRRIAGLPDPDVAARAIETTADGEDAAEIRIARAELSIAAAELRQARAQRWPTVSMDASLDKDISGRQSADFLEADDEPRWMVNLSWTAQGNVVNQRVRAATLAQQAATSRVDAAALTSNDAVRGLRALITGDVERLAILEQRQQSIEQVRGLYREQYKLGTLSILDLLSAEQELYQARSEWEVARHEYWTRLIGLVAATAQTQTFYKFGADPAEPRSVQ
ncbi:TolC family protein [Panacagrimonas sp.]|uniref:TolC family protein n=1 Tax=Panacagrimonas sp. TaxID=2480088 RepID=UPI003B521FF7